MNHNLELNHLKYFYYTVVEGGVQQAADKLHVQQPVVSKMLQKLEGELQQPLFEKKGRKKVLTHYGQMIYRHCRIIFSELNLLSLSHIESKEVVGAFNLCATEPIVQGLLSKALKKISTKFPQVVCNVLSTTQEQILSSLLSNSAELGLMFYIDKLPMELEIVKRISFPFRLVVKSSQANKKETLESFIGSREIESKETKHFPTLDLIRKKYPRARIRFSSNSISLHKKLVLEGCGVSILPEFIVIDEIKKGRLKDVFPKKQFQWDLLVVKRASTYLSLPGQSLIEFL